MHLPVLRQCLLRMLVAGFIMGAQKCDCWAVSLTVNSGYDLFESAPGTTFPGLGPLVGVPLGAYDFGSGPVPVGNADTIVRRLSDVTVAAAGNTASTNLTVLALQLETAAPVNFAGNGLDNYFFELQSFRGGPPTSGQMSITFTSTAGGTFSSFFDVFFDIRKGSLNGPIVMSSDLTATSNAAWGRTSPPSATTIAGINFQLDGSDTDRDFWPVTPLQEVYPNGAVQVLTVATNGIPEPSILVMVTSAAACIPWGRRRFT